MIKARQVSGHTNDGNNAIRFFNNADCCAEITGMYIYLIKRLYIILQALSSGVIHAEKFWQLCHG